VFNSYFRHLFVCAFLYLLAAVPQFPAQPLENHKHASASTVVQAERGRAKKIDARFEEVRRAVQEKLNELHKNADFPGATVGIVFPGGESLSVSTGLSDREKNRTLVPSDKMLAGSIGKTYVSALVMQLIQEGKLNLDEKIKWWLGKEKWFSRLPNAEEITLRMLMNHTSGISEHVLDKKFLAAVMEQPDKVWSPEELVAYILDTKPLFPAGKGWSYADTNYILVGMIIERVTRQPLYNTVTRRILQPLKLGQTVPSDKRIISGLITGYSMPNSPFGFEGAVIVDGKFIVNPQFEWTGGGFASTAEDLARWAKALYEGKAFDKKYLAEMLSAVEAKTGKGDKYGLGVQVRPSEWGMTYGHSGWFPGYLSNMEYYPEQKIAVAIQFNTDNGRALKKGIRAYTNDIARVVISLMPTLK
jgi:D-alanyl-D-alanine carboxypeptidase